MGLDLNRQEYAVEQVTEEVFPGDGRCYRVIFENGIGLRTGPSIGSERSGDDLVYGEVFEISRELRKGNRRYYELADGRGWAFDWIEIQGERWELVELAAQLYSVAFPEGIYGVMWGSDTTLRFTTVMDFTESCRLDLTQAGVCTGDVLVMIDDDPIVGLPLGKTLERVWASCGYQPGDGTFYRVTTKGPYGIGIRTEPDINAPRTGEDLLRGEIFEVDEIAPSDGEGPTYLHLADDRGWVFDTSPIDPESPSCEDIKAKPPGAIATMWRGDPQTLMKALGLKFKQDGFGQPFKITVLEEGQPPQIIRADPGSNLRQNLVENGFNVYADFRGAFHCNARSLCGTCVLHVTEGNQNLTVYSVNEKRAMAANPDGFRLCCNVDVYGDCTVRLRPRDIIYGGPTM